MQTMTATYSPDDNKLRLYSSSRLDADLYKRVHEAGFKWAPKQELFVAPMWTPSREDLLIELCGEIEDEDKSLVERAEERADRFEDLSVKRADDADRAHKTVSAICDGIPFGQPILVGHHSERHARKDAERIENGMRRAVKLFETSEYWKSRAAGALRNAKYKELPGVRHRRIKGLEADKRKTEKSKAEAQHWLNAWSKDGLTQEQAVAIAGFCWLHLPRKEGDREDFDQCPTAHGVLTNAHPTLYAPRSLSEVVEHAKAVYPKSIAHCDRWLNAWSKDGLTQEQAVAIAGFCWLHLPRKEGDREDFNQCPTAHSVLTNAHPTLYAPRSLSEVVEHAKAVYPKSIAHCDRWLVHYENRIAYERAMLDEQGGLKADGFDIQVGGKVLIRGEWVFVIRINKKDGCMVSVTTNCRYVPVRGIEEIKDYRAPSAEEAAKMKAALKTPPLVNFPGEGFAHMTKEQWDKVPKDYKGTNKHAATADAGAYRVRCAMGAYSLPNERDMNKRHSYPSVYITDAKRVDIPTAPATLPEPVKFERERDIQPAIVETTNQTQAEEAPSQTDNRAEAFSALRDQLREGVKVVSAPQLFPTPAPLAARMVELANIEAGHSVLEPSAGTARILRAILATVGGSTIRTAIEINANLCQELRRADPGAHVFHADFMEYESQSRFNAIVMNPPFSQAQDIDHIKRAFGMLKPGGKLVAICANGSRQNAQLRPLVEACGGLWEPLPPNTFAESGTAVNAVLLTLAA